MQEARNAADRGIFNCQILNYAFKHELATFDFVPELPSVKTPVMVLAGKEDFITPVVHSQEIADAIPAAELHVLEKAAHNVYTDRPETLDMMIEFMSRNFTPTVS
jgi:proline iminopeptidase